MHCSHAHHCVMVNAARLGANLKQFLHGSCDIVMYLSKGTRSSSLFILIEVGVNTFIIRLTHKNNGGQPWCSLHTGVV